MTAAILAFIPVLLGLISGQVALRVFAGRSLSAPNALALLVWLLFLAALLRTSWPEQVFALWSDDTIPRHPQVVTADILLGMRTLVLPFVAGALTVDLLRAVLARTLSSQVNPILEAARPIAVAVFIVLACTSLAQRSEALFGALLLRLAV